MKNKVAISGQKSELHSIKKEIQHASNQLKNQIDKARIELKPLYTDRYKKLFIENLEDIITQLRLKNDDTTHEKLKKIINLAVENVNFSKDEGPVQQISEFIVEKLRPSTKYKETILANKNKLDLTKQEKLNLKENEELKLNEKKAEDKKFRLYLFMQKLYSEGKPQESKNTTQVNLKNSQKIIKGKGKIDQAKISVAIDNILYDAHDIMDSIEKVSTIDENKIDHSKINYKAQYNLYKKINETNIKGEINNIKDKIQKLINGVPRNIIIDEETKEKISQILEEIFTNIDMTLDEINNSTKNFKKTFEKIESIYKINNIIKELNPDDINQHFDKHDIIHTNFAEDYISEKYEDIKIAFDNLKNSVAKLENIDLYIINRRTREMMEKINNSTNYPYKKKTVNLLKKIMDFTLDNIFDEINQIEQNQTMQIDQTENENEKVSKNERTKLSIEDNYLDEEMEPSNSEYSYINDSYSGEQKSFGVPEFYNNLSLTQKYNDKTKERNTEKLIAEKEYDDFKEISQDFKKIKEGFGEIDTNFEKEIDNNSNMEFKTTNNKREYFEETDKDDLKEIETLIEEMEVKNKLPVKDAKSIIEYDEITIAYRKILNNELESIKEVINKYDTTEITKESTQSNDIKDDTSEKLKSSKYKESEISQLLNSTDNNNSFFMDIMKKNKELNNKIEEISLEYNEESFKLRKKFYEESDEINLENNEQETSIYSGKGEEIYKMKINIFTKETPCELPDGNKVNIKKYRTIDLKPELINGKKGPLYLSLAAQYTDGNNVNTEDFATIEIHFDKNGKLQLMSTPLPIFFIDNLKDESPAYIIRNNKILTLPIKRKDYNEMQKSLNLSFESFSTDISKANSKDQINIEKRNIRDKVIIDKKSETNISTTQRTPRSLHNSIKSRRHRHLSNFN